MFPYHFDIHTMAYRLICDLLIPFFNVRIDVNGMTALGPALMASVAMAGNIKGSKVIICTDGQANVGVGTLPDDFAGEQRISDCRNTYTSFGQFAKDKGYVPYAECRILNCAYN